MLPHAHTEAENVNKCSPFNHAKRTHRAFLQKPSALQRVTTTMQKKVPIHKARDIQYDSIIYNQKPKFTINVLTLYSLILKT